MWLVHKSQDTKKDSISTQSHPPGRSLASRIMGVASMSPHVISGDASMPGSIAGVISTRANSRWLAAAASSSPADSVLVAWWLAFEKRELAYTVVFGARTRRPDRLPLSPVVVTMAVAVLRVAAMAVLSPFSSSSADFVVST